MNYTELQIDNVNQYNNLREMALETEPEAFISTNIEESHRRKEGFYST